MKNKQYNPTNPELWSGRNSKIKNEYWFQNVQLQNLLEWNGSKNSDIALLGYACEEGVKRNQGRIGAKQAPDLVRQRLGKLAFHQSKTITDFGNILCENEDLETCQSNLAETVKSLIESNTFPIIIGGGHDIAYGHFNGILQATKKENPKIGIINFDAHFDLRPLETKPNSGTPFYQILTENPNNVNYCAIGIQKQSNTKQLFEIAVNHNVKTILSNDCTMENLPAITKVLNQFITQNDYLYITIDVDGFSSAYALGVSAPSPLGFTPQFVMEILKVLFESKKVISLDIAELNPTYDIDNATANLVARLVDFIVEIQS